MGEKIYKYAEKLRHTGKQVQVNLNVSKKDKHSMREIHIEFSMYFLSHAFHV